MCTEIIKKLTPHPTIPTDTLFPVKSTTAIKSGKLSLFVELT
jgi:hypothetical protein|tara:strand:- start:579 stop:704 length:126 start_codon:yes stop_codon:yes gene_type:complete